MQCLGCTCAKVYLLFIGNLNLTVWTTAWALNLGSAIKCPESSAL